jgi:hypothetical protein
MSAPSEKCGADGCFPAAGPVPYLTDQPDQAASLLTDDTAPPVRTWWHVTYAEAVPQIAATGLVPSCWFGGDTCAVFGVDDRAAVPSWRADDWLIEVRSPAPPGPVKAWWVPPTAIVGAWHRGEFHDIRAGEIANPPPVDGCSCPLTAICRDQQQAWRASLDQ